MSKMARITSDKKLKIPGELIEEDGKPIRFMEEREEETTENIQIAETETTTADFEEGTLTDVVAVDDGLELANNPALEFDGVDTNFIDLPSSFSSTAKEYTFEARLKYESDGYAYDQDDRFIWSFGSYTENGGIGWYDGSWHTFTDGSNNVITPLTGWHHYAVTITSGGIFTLYIDGDEKSTVTANVKDLEGTRGLFKGGHDYKGSSNEYRIWETVRTQTEIQDNMHKELSGNEDGLFAYYKMNEGSGSTLTDSAGNNDGTIYGATWDTTSYYKWNGNRQSPQLDLSPISTVESSLIEWTETLNGETITIETSVDGGSTWQEAANGDAIPNLPADPNTLDVRQNLSTTDSTATPILNELYMEVNGETSSVETKPAFIKTPELIESDVFRIDDNSITVTEFIEGEVL